MLRFGTDGVRGVANTELTPELALALGRAAASVLEPAQVVVGVDGRRSGPLLASALAAGFASAGVDVELAGLAPTPAIAHRSAVRGVVGAMVSASHNPFPDNGIKLFATGGRKLTDPEQERIESALERLLGGVEAADAPSGAAVGRIDDCSGDGLDDYADAVRAALDGRRLDGLRVLLDCAHGAASFVAPAVLESLGADVTVLHAAPDGVNINEDAGSTSPEALCRAVADAGVDLGLALDGDADRLLAVAADGTLVDGDEVMAVLALDRKTRRALPGDRVVVTVMTNLGFRLGMRAAGIEVVDTKVGDRYVLEALAETGAVLGGEQSGHVIQTDLSTTGDGLLTAVTLCDVVARTGTPLGTLAASAMTKLPQVLVNVTLAERSPDIVDRLAADIAATEARLGDHGRVLVRPSGTEPKIRVMVEAPTDEQATAEAETLADAVRRMA